MQWKRDNAKYSSGALLMLGAWDVGGAYYDSGRSRDDPLKYAAACRLPGIKGHLGHYATADEAKAKVEYAVKYWIRKLPEGVMK